MKVLIIHGLMSTVKSWEPLMKALVKHGHFVTLSYDNGIDNNRDIDDFQDYCDELRTMLTYNHYDAVIMHGMGCIHSIHNEDILKDKLVILINPVFTNIMRKGIKTKYNILSNILPIKNIFTYGPIGLLITKMAFKPLSKSKYINKTIMKEFRKLSVNPGREYIKGMNYYYVDYIPSSYKLVLCSEDKVIDIEKAINMYDNTPIILYGSHMACWDNMSDIIQISLNFLKTYNI